MKELVESFTAQLKTAKQIAEKAIITSGNKISNVIITGLGGSGIGGTILTELVDNCPVPVIINKGYFLPSFVNETTLVIVSSYSGNTEETLQAFQDALSKKAQIICVTSGGKILELAKQNHLEFIEIPGGFPPRSCIGYSLIQLIKIFIAKGLASKNLMDEIDASIKLLDAEKNSIKNDAQQIAKKLLNKLAVLYSLGSCEGVSV
ncbi:MAG: bifunctional phosphoglucose/phosphomannose isomerase, partial [Bacteroidia bacterium]|nr:bifunctional phosphoglucose/phosphomannose isomerase [Bacteroidia bacterium]